MLKKKSDTAAQRVKYHHFLQAIVAPDELFAPSKILDAMTDRSAKGVYAWWFRNLPRSVPLDGAVRLDGSVLVYVGTSKGPIRGRMKYHLKPDASRSTLRLSLGSLLSQHLDLRLRVCRLVKNKPRFDFGDGESILSAWMEKNARISWVKHSEPLQLESYLIHSLIVPLNLDGNVRHPFCDVLSNMRGELRSHAVGLGKPK